MKARKPSIERPLLIFSFTEQGFGLAQTVASLAADATALRPSELKGGVLRKKVAAAFRRGGKEALVFISASGIAVRTIAPFLKDKSSDPAVLLLDIKGKFVISLLSGHLGGANELTRALAHALGAVPVITTATDSEGLPCIEELASGFSLTIENPRAIKRINAAILRGEKITVADANPERLLAMKKAFAGQDIIAFKRSLAAKKHDGELCALISYREGDPAAARADIVLRPREFVVGIGCRRGVTMGEVRAAYLSVLGKRGLSPLSVRNLATVDIKKTERGLTSFARREGLAIEFFSTGELGAVRPPSGASAALDKLGVPGVSESAALISASTERLWIKKKISGRITIAVARAPFSS